MSLQLTEDATEQFSDEDSIPDDLTEDSESENPSISNADDEGNYNSTADIESLRLKTWKELDECCADFGAFALLQGFVIWRATSKTRDGRAIYKSLWCHKASKGKIEEDEALHKKKKRKITHTLPPMTSVSGPTDSESKECGKCPFHINVKFYSIEGVWKCEQSSVTTHNHSLLSPQLVKFSPLGRKIEQKVVNHIRVLCKGNHRITSQEVVADIMKTFPEYGASSASKGENILFVPDVKNLIQKFKRDTERENQAQKLIDELTIFSRNYADFYFTYKKSGIKYEFYFSSIIILL